jgi:putative Mn2+ efflux pump MntP
MFIKSVLVILFIALSLDNYLVINRKGATIRNLNFKNTLLYSFVFTIANALVLVLAFFSSNLFEYLLPANLDFFINIALLVILGFFYIYKAINYAEFEEILDKDFSFKKCVELAFITSVDTFLVGIVLALLDVNFTLVLANSAFYTFVASILGLRIGYSMGVKLPRVLQGIAGGMYIIFSLLISVVYMVI